MFEQTSTGYFQNQYKFNGKELDQETGLYYYGARYYDPKGSLWLSVDPLEDKFPSYSPYNYCLNNPVRITDPDGMGPFDEIANRIINKASNIIAQKIEDAVVETGKAIVKSARSFASKLEVGVRLEGGANLSLGMQAGVKGEAIGGQANLYSEDVINLNGNVEYTKKGGDSHINGYAEVYVKNDARDKRSNHSVSVSETILTPIGVIGLEQNVSITSSNQQNNQSCKNRSSTFYSGVGWNSVAGVGAYYTNSNSNSVNSDETGVRVGTSGSAILVGGVSYDLSLCVFIRVRNDNE